jgi:glycosyltransferase involved in cell wall biosynthesis
MKLSIILPTWNVGEYIEECLDSILPQLTDECELIIVDDHSTDNTVPKIIEKIGFGWEDENKYKFYINMENKGVSKSRNIGIDVASGEYIAFLDGDDLLLPNYVKNVLEAIKKKKDYYKASWERFNIQPGVFFAKHLPDWNCAVWTTIIRKDKIKFMFDEKLRKCEDKKFLEENITNDMSCGYIDEPIYKYRGGRIGSLSNE